MFILPLNLSMFSCLNVKKKNKDKGKDAGASAGGGTAGGPASGGPPSAGGISAVPLTEPSVSGSSEVKPVASGGGGGKKKVNAGLNGELHPVITASA